MKHFLKLADLTKTELIGLLDLADELKKQQKSGGTKKYLEGKAVGLIFMKASTRTRISFETGVYQLGGHPLFLNAKDLQLGRGESIEDTARVLSRYLSGIMIRTFAQSDVETLAEVGSIPVINGLTDYAHPCQVLADLQTIREYKGGFDGLKMCYIGDGNNMANSLIVGGLLAGMEVSCAIPENYRPHETVLNYAKAYGDKFKLFSVPAEAAVNADVIFTDVWASMGMEGEKEQREKDFAGYQVNAELMALAKKDCIVQHCLPAHKGEEITFEVFEAHQQEIFDEAENRLHAQKAVMVELMGKE